MAMLGLVFLPLGVTIVEILAAVNAARTLPQPDVATHGRDDATSQAITLGSGDGSWARTSRTMSPDASGGVETHADLGEHA
jgi:hypothetical protein